MQSELSTVLDALWNERNLTVISSDKSKRANLIHDTFSYLRKQEENAFSYYIDIADTRTVNDFRRLVAEIILGKQDVSLKGTFLYLLSLEKWVFIAIDNFQQILQYPEKGTDALLRSYVQELFNINFIFAGNNDYKMYEMFASPAKPFYQSTQILTLP